MLPPCWCANSQVALEHRPAKKRAQTGRPVRRSTGSAAATFANRPILRAPRLGQPSQNGRRAAPARVAADPALQQRIKPLAVMLPPMAPRHRAGRWAASLRAGDGERRGSRGGSSKARRRDVGLAKDTFRSGRSSSIAKSSSSDSASGPLTCAEIN